MNHSLKVAMAAAALLVATPLHAFELHYGCSGNTPRRAQSAGGGLPSLRNVYVSNSSTPALAAIAMPTGSGYYDSLLNALSRWAAVPGAAAVYNTTPVQTATLTHLDNFSDTWVDTALDAGLRGQTYVVTENGGSYTYQTTTDNMAFLAGGCNLVAADVVLAPQSRAPAITFNPLKPEYAAGDVDALTPEAGNLGYIIALHEWGHAYGLLHSWSSPPATEAAGILGVMIPGNNPRPVIANTFPLLGSWFTGATTTPAADDVRGMRALYADGTTLNNVAASSATLKSTSAVGTTNWQATTINNGSTSLDVVCRGSTRQLKWTTHNLGTNNVAFATQQLRISTSATAFAKGSGLALWSGYWSIDRARANVVGVQIPCCAPSGGKFPAGTYYVYHDADSTNALPSDDNDDTVRTWKTLTISNCDVISCSTAVCP